jgi:hypothetical protein
VPRTTPQLVRGVIRVKDGVDLTPFIDSASLLVTKECTSSGYTDGHLELIERWLAAHFYDVNFPRRSMGGAGEGVTEQMEPVRVDLGFNNTKYGQQALRLDVAGNLAGLENWQKTVKKPTGFGARTKWLGTADGG